MQVLRQLKDHERLDCYINQIPPSRHGEFRGKIQSLLNNTVSTGLLSDYRTASEGKLGGAWDEASHHPLWFQLQEMYTDNQQ